MRRSPRAPRQAASLALALALLAPAPALAQAPVWGIGRTALREQPELGLAADQRRCHGRADRLRAVGAGYAGSR